MRNFVLIAVLALLALAVGAESGTAVESAASPSQCPVDPKLVGVDRLSEIINPYYPDCRTMQGQYCSTPGAWAWCQWQPGEPEICVCQPNHTWQCG